MDLERDCRLDPRDPASWYYRADVRARSGDLAGALADATKAADLLPAGTPQREDVESLKARIRQSMGGK